MIATATTLGLPLLYVLMAPQVTREGKTLPLWQAIWPLFGSSNQLLAALTLLLLTVWMRERKRWPAWVFIPSPFYVCDQFYSTRNPDEKSMPSAYNQGKNVLAG